MPQNDFYNHNRFIAYPLKALNRSEFPFGAVSMKESALLDAGFVLGIDADYDPEYRVKLTTLTVVAATVTFTFQDEAATATFEVTFNASDPAGTLVEVEASESSAHGHAWAVAGDLAELTGAVPPGTYTASESLYVEEGTVQSLSEHYVKQFSIASQPDTPWHPTADCGGSPADIWQYTVTGRNLQGDRKFKPGYNAVISVATLDNAIEISAGVGAGEGEPCERVPLGSMSSISSMSLSSVSLSSTSLVPAAPTCRDIFSTINGVWPDALGNFYLKALSPGLVVETYPDEHKIVVDFRTGANSPYCED